MRLPIPSRFRHRRRSRGQSVVELALILPLLLLVLLVAIDFGRVYLGWINLQQMTRVAANYAADNATAWGDPGDPVIRSKYQTMVANDATLINCLLPNPLPAPIFASGTAIGSRVQVDLNCEFGLITPIISSIVGNTILASASVSYPIKEGVVSDGTGGGNPIVPPPGADFIGSPISGWAPLPVTFTDASTGNPSSWTWDFSVGTPSGTGSGTVSTSSSLAKGPHTVTYQCAGTPGDTCTFSVRLVAANAGGSSTETKTDFVTVTVPPDSGPIAEFTGTPRSGTNPLMVNFAFEEITSGVTYSDWQWQFGDGTTGSGQAVSHTYSSLGIRDVTLTVTDSSGATNSVTKVGYIVVERRICTVPDFAGVRRFPQGNQPHAQQVWDAAGFTTPVISLPANQGPANGNYVIQYQSILGGTIDPQPGGCASDITVGP